MKIASEHPNAKKIILTILIFVLAVGIVGTLAIFIIKSINSQSKNQPLETTVSTAEQAASDSTKDNIIHFAAMGDMLAHDTIIANAKDSESNYDFTKFFANIKSVYKDDDLIFCNQEGLSSGETYGISGYPSFNAPTKFATDLSTGVGCNMINLANNHMGDKGVDATNATLDVWSGLKPLLISGANKSAEDQKNVSYATLNNIKIGYVSFADFNNSASTPAYSINNYHDEALVRSIITKARENADVVIVSMHWGTEDSNIVDDEQTSYANLLSSLGVDIIIGTGPHVLQPVSIISRADGGQTIVWYSLGNMLSSQLTIAERIGGIARMDITKNDDGKISIGNLTFTPTYMHYDWTETEAANYDLLARKNAMIYLLSNAADPLSRSLLNTTIEEQRQYVINTLSDAIKIAD